MGNLKDIQDITGLTSEAIFNIRKPVDYMCSDIDSHIKDIRTQCDYIMDGDEEDVKYYSKSIKSDVDSYFEDIRSKVENLRDWGVYSDITLPSGDMGTIKVERIDDDKKDNDIK